MQISSTPNVTPPKRALEVAGSHAAVPALATKAKAQEGDDTPKKPSGIAGWAAEKLVKVGGDIKKLPTWEKILVGAVGAFTGWKLNDWVHNQIEKADGNRYEQYGQEQYGSLKRNGIDKLVAAVAENHSEWNSLKEGDPLKSQWRAFNTYTALAETALPTIGDLNGKPNQPVVLIALASNKTADDKAMTALAADLRTRIHGTPGKQEFYQPVIDALKANHNISVL